jgi:DNA-binding NarL/FixJ family response regulator
MSALDKRGEFGRDRHAPCDTPHAASLPDALRAKADSRLLIVVVDDRRAIAQIRALASACVEIDDRGDASSYSTTSTAVPTMKGLQDGLTQRQFEIALGVMRGLSNKGIGRQLGISHFTVRNHLSRILLLLGLSSRQELGDYIRSRLLQPT